MLLVKSIKNLKTLKDHTFMIKYYFVLVFVMSVIMRMIKTFEEENLIEMFKFHGSINNM